MALSYKKYYGIIGMNYLIIGNGAAGIEAALAVRKNDPDGAVRIITASRHLHYYRPKLIEYLAGETPLEKLIIYKEEFYIKNRIENIPGTVITRIITGENRVVDSDGRSHEYDRLLLATGACPFVPPVKGISLEGVFTLRGITDADIIKNRCTPPGHVVVIGGGLLGLETAHSLMKTGLKVTVVEFCRWLLPRQLDEAAGKTLLGMLTNRGISFILDDSVSSIEGNGKAETVVLNSGDTLHVDAVIVSAGIRCRTDLAVEAGLATGNGVIVDDYMRTSAENVYAAGDLIEHRGKLYGIWPAAREQGRIAGLNMAGVDTVYSGTLMSNTLKVTGIDLFSAGDFNARNCEILVRSGTDTYRKLLLDMNHPLGAVILGGHEAVTAARKVMDGKAGPEELKRFF